jgi:DNA-binding transcriptional MocR family regulator
MPPEPCAEADMTQDDRSPPVIAEKIRESIRSGALQPGSHLGAAALAEQFGVSRGPVAPRSGFGRSPGAGIPGESGPERIPAKRSEANLQPEPKPKPEPELEPALEVNPEPDPDPEPEPDPDPEPDREPAPPPPPVTPAPDVEDLEDLMFVDADIEGNAPRDGGQAPR